MASAPLLAQLDVLPRTLGDGQITVRIFKQRIQFEADIAVIATRLLPNGQKNFLGLAHEHIGKAPGDILIAEPFAHQAVEVLVEATAFDEIGDDDRVGGGAGGAQGAVAFDEVGIDRIEPQLGARGDE